ncbi:MAG: hypothetical protein ACXAEU_24840 [Candidatus Hodarchaeales archaeon]|jgi:hypothetical protein
MNVALPVYESIEKELTNFHPSDSNSLSNFSPVLQQEISPFALAGIPEGQGNMSSL